MKRFLLLIPCLMVLYLVPSCSDIPDDQRTAFIKFYGSYQGDFGKDVIPLASGGYALTGTLQPDSVPKMVLLLTDEFGNQSEGSPICYGDAYQTNGNAIMETGGDEPGYLIAGSIDSLAGDERQSDAYLVRTRVDGTVAWSMSYGGEENDEIFHIAPRTGGGFVCAGKRTTDEQEDVWIFMVDASGKMIHELTGSDLDDDDEANYVLNTGKGYLVGCTYDEGAFEGTDYFVIYLDEQCNIISTMAMGTEDDDHLRTILPFGGGYLVTGYTENTASLFNQIRLYAFNIEGNQLINGSEFATISQTGADLYGEGAVVNSLGEIVIFGTIEVNENKDMMMLFLDENGQETRDRREFGELGNQVGSAVKKTPDGGLVSIGSNGLEANSVISLIRTNARGEF